MRAERRETVPENGSSEELAQFFLPKIIRDATDIKLMNPITEWLKAKFN